MAKKVFRATDLTVLTKPLVLDAPSIELFEGERRILEEKKKEEEEEKPAGPSLEEIEEELSRKREEFEHEMNLMLEKTEQDSSKIKNEAENWAFSKVKDAKNEYENRINDANYKAQSIVGDAEAKAREIMNEAQSKSSMMYQDAYQKGYEDGRDEGFTAGKEEHDRLITRLNIILSSAIQKRNEVIEDAENQVVNIIISICKKIVKTVTEAQKEVVVTNIKEALKKLKGRAEITIRVNTEDLQMTTKHKKEFIEMIEGIEKVKILEDNTVEKGGCIISTDFGSIDARISSQLSEIEAKIKEVSPYKEEY